MSWLARPVSLPTTEPEARPAARWGLGDVGITLGLTVFLGTLVAAVTKPWVDAGGTGAAWSIVAELVIPWLALAGWPLYVARSKGNGPRLDYRLGLTWRGAGIGVLGGLFALGAASVVQWLTQLVVGHPFDSTVGQLADTVAHDRLALVVFAACAAFGAPVAEEIAFRGLVFGSLRKFGLPVLWSVGYTGLAFAIFHLEPVRLPLLLTIGLVLTGVRAYTDSTGASVVAHMTVNIPGALAILQLSGH